MSGTYRKTLISSCLGYVCNPIDYKKLIEEDRLQKVLVRCGSGRFTCAVQDAEHFISIITKEGSDYVRDVSVFTN